MPIQPRPERTNALFAVANLKRCPLCNAINAEQNPACFACGWHGQFDRDPDALVEGLNLLIDRCPELAATQPPRQLGFWQRLTLRLGLRRKFRLGQGSPT